MSSVEDKDSQGIKILIKVHDMIRAKNRQPNRLYEETLNRTTW